MMNSPPKILISDQNRGERITEVETVWTNEGFSFEVAPKYIDLQIEDTITTDFSGRGTPWIKTMFCHATDSSIDTKKKKKSTDPDQPFKKKQKTEPYQESIDTMTSSTDNVVVIRKICELMNNHRVVWSIIREINFFRHTKKKFLHLFIHIHDIMIPCKRELFDSRIDDMYLVYRFDANQYHNLRDFIVSVPHEEGCRLILAQLLLMVFYLKSINTEHRELAPVNIKMKGMKVQVSCLRSSCQSAGGRRKTNLEKTVDRLVLRDDKRALWYRPPEALLDCAAAYEGTYDIWSIGCIFGELLYKKTLFKGEYREEQGEYREEQQLHAIADILGDPTPDDLEFISGDDNNAGIFKTSVLQKTAIGTNKPSIPFSELIPDAEPAALDLLSKLVKYNPRERITVEDALNHEYVKEVIDTDEELKSLFTEIKDEYKYNIAAEKKKIAREEKEQAAEKKIAREEKEQRNSEEPDVSADDQEFLRKTLLREKFLFCNANPNPFFLCNPKPRKL